MILGKFYGVYQSISIGERGKKHKTWGRCIWVHPEKRFCVLEFDGGTKECFTKMEIGG